MVWSPEFRCVVGAGGERSWRVGHEVVDGFFYRYLMCGG